ELRHEDEAPVEIETPRVVAAADLARMAGRRHEDVAAMRADVGEAPERPSGIARKKEGLVEAAGKEVARRERSAQRDVVERAQPLPRPGEHALEASRVRPGIGIEAAFERARGRDVGIDRIHRPILAMRVQSALTLACWI